MRKISTYIVCCSIVIWLLNIDYTHAQTPSRDGQYVANQVIVKVKAKSGFDKSTATNISVVNRALPGIKIVSEVSLAIVADQWSRRKPSTDFPILYTLDQDIDDSNAINELMATGLFEYVEPNYIGYGGGSEGCGIVPNDEEYQPRQWGLNNEGTLTADSKVGADIDMERAWTITQGDSSTVVAILDSGIKLDHPEFFGRLWINKDEIPDNDFDEDSNGYYNDIYGWDFVNNDNVPADDHGHGTNISGIVGANSNNNLGYAGVNWQTKIMTCKVLNENNSGFYSAWIAAIYYAVNNGADVINMSMGGTSFSNAMKQAVEYAVAKGVPVVASVMNNDANIIYYPAGYNAVVAVGSVDPDFNRSSPFFFNDNSGSNFGDHIDIVAPGNYIYGLNYKGNYDFNRMWGGTSQSVPYVTGVISLIKAMMPDITVDSIKQTLYRSAADQVGRPDEDTEGWDPYHGHGVLNAYRALKPFNVTFEETQVCYGDDYILPDGHVIENITDAQTYTSVVASTGGCNKTIVTQVSILPVSKKNLAASLCSGEAYVFPDGNEIDNIEESFVYESQLANQYGCDSLIYTTVTVNPIYNQTEQVSLCEGSSFTFPDGVKKVNIEGDLTYTSELTSSFGCDSIITTTVKVDPSYERDELVAICSGASYTFADGNTVADIIEPFIYTSELTTIQGCDSLINTSVSVNETYNEEENISVCFDGSYTFPDGSLKEGIQEDISHVSLFQSVYGCDSLITTYVSVTVIDSGLSVSDTLLICNETVADYQWIDCESGDIIEGEIEEFLKPETNGEYAAIISKDGCSVQTDCFYVRPLSVELQIDSDMSKVYPNPTRGIINIDPRLLRQSKKIELLDYTGQVLQTFDAAIERDMVVDQPKGLYVLNVYLTNEVYSFKIVKK